MHALSDSGWHIRSEADRLRRSAAMMRWRSPAASAFAGTLHLLLCRVQDTADRFDHAATAAVQHQQRAERRARDVRAAAEGGLDAVGSVVRPILTRRLR
jgi:hypothetical protein